MAVTAHRLLTSAAALRLALETLADHEIPEDRRPEVLAIAQRHAVALEDGLRELILLPRDGD